MLKSILSKYNDCKIIKNVFHTDFTRCIETINYKYKLYKYTYSNFDTPTYWISRFSKYDPDNNLASGLVSYNLIFRNKVIGYMECVIYTGEIKSIVIEEKHNEPNLSKLLIYRFINDRFDVVYNKQLQRDDNIKIFVWYLTPIVNKHIEDVYDISYKENLLKKDGGYEIEILPFDIKKFWWAYITPLPNWLWL